MIELLDSIVSLCAFIALLALMLGVFAQDFGAHFACVHSECSPAVLGVIVVEKAALWVVRVLILAALRGAGLSLKLAKVQKLKLFALLRVTMLRGIIPREILLKSVFCHLIIRFDLPSALLFFPLIFALFLGGVFGGKVRPVFKAERILVRILFLGFDPA